MTTVRSTADFEAADRGAMASAGKQPSQAAEALRGGSIQLRQPPSKARARPLGGLARLLRLEVYSDRLLTRRVRTELSILAIVLLLVFLYEFAAWSFFFNGLFLGRVTAFDAHWTGAAIFLGFLFAGVVLYFERQVVTTDVQRLTSRQRRMAQGIRVCAVFLSAFIVLHAVELVFFGKPVERALHSRAVARSIKSLKQDLNDMATTTAEPRQADLAQDLTGIGTRIEETERRQEEAIREIASARESVKRWEEEVSRRQDELAAAQRRLGEQVSAGVQFEPQTLRNEVEAARRRYEDAQTHYREATATLQATQGIAQEINRSLHTLDGNESAVREERSSLWNRTDARQRAIETLRSRLRDWEAELLSSAEPGDHKENWSGLEGASQADLLFWPERWRQNLEFNEPEWSFFERIAMIYELAWGGQQSTATPTESTWLRTIYQTSFVGLHLAGIFIPLLVFAVKWFLMPQEVDAYYSAWHQAYAGDPDARLLLSVEEKVRSNDAKW